MRSAVTNEEDSGPSRHGAFVPLLLLALAVVGWLAFQSTQLLRERDQLSNIESSLRPQEQNAAKLRASLDAVATATAKLAAAGNANARVIVDELRRRGVTINPSEGGKPP
jgi:hypothetical protein